MRDAPSRGRRVRLRPPRRATAATLALALLQPLVALTLPAGDAAAAHADGCLALDDAGDRLLDVALDGTVVPGPSLDPGAYGAAAWRPDGMLLVARGSALVAVDPVDGAGTDLAAGAPWTIAGLAIDARTLETFAVSPDGELARLDPWSGGVVTDGLGPGTDTVALGLAPGSTLGDLALLPSGDLVVVRHDAAGDQLVTVERGTWTTGTPVPILLPSDGSTATTTTVSEEPTEPEPTATETAPAPTETVTEPAPTEPTSTGTEPAPTETATEPTPTATEPPPEPTPATVSTTSTTSDPVTGVAALSVDPDGELHVATGSAGTPPGEVLAVDAASGTATPHAATGGDPTALVCSRPAGIGVDGTVFVDDDRDGALGASETTAGPGTTVTLSSGGTVLQTTLTAADGTYAFWTVATDALGVVATVPAGAGTTTTDAVPATGGTVDIGYRFATLSGVVFDDLDGDGARDPGEAGLDAVEVTVSVATDGDGTTTTSATSASDGTYVVDGLPGGEATVTVPTATGAVAGSPDPDPVEVTLAAAGTATADVGYDGRATLAGEVWNDVDGLGDRDLDEPVLAGVTVVAVDGAGDEHRVATDGSGGFVLAVPPGPVSLGVEDLPPDATVTSTPYPLVLDPAPERAATVTGLAIGVRSLAVVSGQVWNDLDGDGVPVAGERGFAGVPVTLVGTTDAGGAVTTTTASDPDGAFRFPDLRPGTYTVTVDDTDPDDDLPAGLPTTGDTSPASVTITAEGEVAVPLRFGRVGPTSIAGVVFEDLDGDGVRGPTEGPLAGVTVRVSPDDADVTDADGTYALTGLAHGEHALDVEGLPSGATTTPALPVTVVTTAGAVDPAPRDVGVDTSAGLAGTVFSDRDGEGDRDAGEPPIAGATVTATHTDGRRWSDDTDDAGAWAIEDLPRGTYDVTVDPPVAGVPTTPVETRTDVDASGVGTVTVPDVGIRLAAVGGRVFGDLDDDGARTDDEALLDGVGVTLRDADGAVVATTTTADGGRYRVDELAPGTYTVELDAADLAPAPAPDAPHVVGVAAAGDQHLAEDVAVDHRASLAGTVFDDLDGLGTQDPGEPGLAGVTVRAVPLDDDGTAVEVDSGADGAYRLAGLRPGRYAIEVDGTDLPGDGPAVPTTDVHELVLELATADHRTGLDLGYDRSGDIAGVVWNDVDRNGEQRSGDADTVAEPGFDGVEVILLDADLAELDRRTTGAGGGFAFPDLPAGTYHLLVAGLPAGADPALEDAAEVVLGATTVATVPLGFDLGASTEGAVYNDLDGDGSWETGEPPLAGVTVVLTHEGTGVVATDDSDAAGTFAFADLVPGRYRLTVVAAELGDGVPTVREHADGIVLDLAADEDRSGDRFGLEAPVALAGRVVNDLDRDGQDDGEPGLAGARVVLLDGDGAEVDDVVVPADGTYAFGPLAPGTWTVVVDPDSVPADADVTFPTVDPDAGIGVGSYTRTLGPNTALAGLDVGYDAGASIAGRLWDDLDGDGLEGDDEPGLGGRTVEAVDPDGAVATSAVTGTDGTYLLEHLAPGTYVVRVAAGELPGYVASTAPTATVTVALAADGTAAPIGYWRPATITFLLFDDLDGDGVRGPDEPGVPARDVVLSRDADGAPAADPLRSTTTGPDGDVVLDELPPGSYWVDPSTPDRYRVTTGADPVPVTLVPGAVVAVVVGVQAFAPDVTVEAGAVTAASGEAGDELAYPFTVTNHGNVPDTFALAAPDVDPDVAVRFVLADDPANAVVATPQLAPDAAVDVVAIVTVPSGRPRGDTIATVVEVTGTTRSPTDEHAAGQVTFTSTVIAPVLAVTVEQGDDGPGFVSPGTTLTYEVVVTNADAAAPATVAAARDLLLEVDLDPAHGTIVPDSLRQGGVGTPAASFPLELGVLDPGGTVTVAFDVTLERPLADGTIVTVGAQATARANPEGDPRVAAAATADTVASSALPDALVTSEPRGDEVVEPGDAVTHTVVLGNREDATDTWREVTLRADLPDTVTVGTVTVDGAPATGDVAGAGIALGDLAPGTYVSVTLPVVIDDPVVDGTVVTAVVAATGANGGPLVAGTSHTVDARLGVAVAADRHATGGAATTVVHPQTLDNTGNVTTVFDLTATTDLGWPTRIVADLDADGAVDDDEPVIAAAPPLAGDDPPLHLLVAVDVPPGEPDGSTATTTLAATSQEGPPAIAQAFAVTTTVAPVLTLDLAVDPPSTVVDRGQTVRYTTTVGNTGGAPARDVVLTDATPADAVYVSGSARVDGQPVPDGDGGSNPFAGGLPLGELAPAGTRTVSFEVTVGDVADGTPLVAQASVTAADDRSASDSVSQVVSASPVLDVQLTSSPAAGTTVSAGTEITYTAVVTNRGSLAATRVTLRSAVPDRTAYVPGSTSVDAAPTADAGGTSPLLAGLDLGTLAPGETRTVRLRVRVADPVFDGEEIVARATLTSDQGVTAASRTLRSVVDVRPAISLTGGGTSDVARPGQAVYPHTVRNAGDVSDTFTLQGRSSRGWRVSLVRDDDGDGVWDPTREITPLTATGPLAPGASVRFFAVVEVAAETTLGNDDTTTVTARSVVDPTVTASTSSRTRATAASLELTMSATPSGGRVNPGADITYVVAVRNRGAAPATEVVLTSATPAGTTYVADSGTRDGQALPDGVAADGNPFASANGGVRVPSIAPGGEVLATFTVTVPPTARVGQVVTASSTAVAAATASASASKAHTVAPGPALDLLLTADPGAATATPAGTRITYTAVVRNTGQEPATDVRVVADTPRDTTYVPGSTRRDDAPVADGRTDPNPLSSVHGGLVVGDLPVGTGGVTIRFSVEVDDPVPADARVEQVVTATADDTSATSPRLVHTVAVTPGATVTPDVAANAVPGRFADLAHTVTNTGDVTDVFALDATSSQGWVTSIHADRDRDGDIGPDEPEVASTPVLAPGEGTTIVVRVAVPEGTPIGEDDVVEVRATSSLDPEVGATARDTIAVVSGALRLTKSAAPLSLSPGARSTYTLTVRNVGTSPATDVRLVDDAPLGTRYVAGSTRRDGTAVADVDGTTALAGGLDLGDLPPGAATTVTFGVVTLDDPGTSTIVNTATATAVDAATSQAGTVQPVSRDHGLDLTTAPDVTVPPGETVVRPHVVTNTGLVPDEVTVTATSATGVPVRVVHDRDGDGVPGDDEPDLLAPVTLAPGERLPVLVVAHYTADVAEGSTDELAVGAASGADPRVRVTVTDAVRVSRADVAVTVTADPAGDVVPGERVSYEVVVTNRAATVAAGVVVTTDTPAGTTFVPGSATRDGEALADGTGGADRNPLSSGAGGLALGELPPDARVVLRFAVVVDGAAGGDTVAAVAGVRIDGGPAVESNTVRAVVVDEAGLQVVKTSSAAAVAGEGETVTWTLSVMNLGGATAADVVLTDPPAAGTRYVPGSTTVDGEPVGDALVTDGGLALGDLAAGATRVVTFRTVVDVPGAVVQNVAAAEHGLGARTLSNLAAVTVRNDLPATGVHGGRTLGGAAALLVSGWMLLYVARPERAPLPVLDRVGGHRSSTRRRRTTP